MASKTRFLLALVVLVVVAAAVLLGTMGGIGDSNSSPADGVATAPAGATPTSRSAAGQPTAANTSGAQQGASRNLQIDEARGGHTLARHVGRSDADLRARLKAEPDISAASTYTDRTAAETSVAAAIAQGQAQIEKWTKGATHPNLVLRTKMPSVIGRSLDRDASNVVDVKSAVVVLAWTARDWFVLTSYPEDR